MDYPINPVISGLRNALLTAQMIQRASLEREALERAIRREEREQALRELDLEHRLLTSGAQPLTERGTYGSPINIPGGLPGGPVAPVSFERYASPERTLEITLGGRQRRYYIPTPEERREQELAGRIHEIQALGDVQRQLELARARELMPIQREAAMVELPGVGTVHSALVPYYSAREAARAASERAEAERRFRAAENEKARQNQMRIAQLQHAVRTVPTPGEKRLLDKQEMEDFEHQIAGQVLMHAGEELNEKTIRAALDDLAARDQTGLIKRRYLGILRAAMQAVPRPKTIAQMTPEELEERWGGGATANRQTTPAAQKSSEPKPAAGRSAEVKARAYLEDLKRRLRQGK